MAIIVKLTIKFDQNRSLRDFKKKFRADIHVVFFTSWSPALGRVFIRSIFNIVSLWEPQHILIYKL